MRKWLISAGASLLFASIAFGQYKNSPPPPQPAVSVQTATTPAPAPTAPSTIIATDPNTPPPPALVTDPNEAARRIMRDEAIEMVKKGKAVWVDVRPKDQYDISHIKGAINYPLGDLEQDLSTGKATDKLPKKKFLITYCA